MGEVTRLRPGEVAKEFTVGLRQKDVERLYDLAKQSGETPTAIIRRSIATESKLYEKASGGGTIFVQHSNGDVEGLDLNYDSLR